MITLTQQSAALAGVRKRRCFVKLLCSRGVLNFKWRARDRRAERRGLSVEQCGAEDLTAGEQEAIEYQGVRSAAELNTHPLPR